MYILRNENNEIIAWSTSQVDDAYVWTDEEIIEVGGSMFLASQIEEIEKETLLYEKSLKISELKSIRNSKEVEPVQTDKGLFDYDDKSRDRLSIARQSLIDNPSVTSIIWTTADNQRVPLTSEDFATINTVAAVRSNELHIKYNTLKEQVNACETVEEVEAISW